MFVLYVHLPPAVYLPRMWAITAHYGDNYLSYNSSYHCEMATHIIYIYLYTRMYIMEKFTFMENQIYTESKYASVAGKPNHCFWFSLYKGYRFSSLRHCTLSYRPTGLLVVQTSEALNCVKHIKKEVVNRELFFSVWMNMVLLLIIYLFFAVFYDFTS